MDKPIADITDLGQRMRYFRELSGMSQTDVSAKTGISKNYLSAVERGVNIPSANILITYAKGCHISLDDIAGLPRDDGILPELRMRLSTLDIETQRIILQMIDALDSHKTKETPPE